MSDIPKLEIKQILKSKAKEYHPPQPQHPHCPQLHFAICIVGPRGRGKSELVRNLLMRNEMLKSVFLNKKNHVIIISQSLDVDGTYDQLEGPNIHKTNTYDAQIIHDVMDAQKEIIMNTKKKRCPEILFVLDDILDSGALNNRSAVEMLFSRGRHLNINIICISQYLHRISTVMRANCDYIGFFYPNNETQLDMLLDEFITKTKRKQMREYLNKMWAKSIYNFLWIDYKTKNLSDRYKCNFSEIINLD
jgi:pyrimidine operon attenuation protein/uracil phosphoribosyltransferase